MGLYVLFKFRCERGQKPLSSRESRGISLFVFGFFFGAFLDVPTCSVESQLESFPCHLEKVPESSRPGSFPGIGRNAQGGDPCSLAAATLVWNANVSSVRSRVLASIKNADSYSPLRQSKTHYRVGTVSK